MMKQIFYIMSINILFLSVIMLLNSTNWMFMWMSLEINILSMIPLMMYNKNTFCLEASIKYFLINSFSSNIFLLCSIILSSYFNKMIISSFLLMSLLIKLGAAPFHFWFPDVMSLSNWLVCFLLSTIQKIGPLMMVSLMFSCNTLISITSMASALIGGAQGMNQTSLRKIMAYSSIVHLGWMLMLIAMNKILFMFMYFILYIIISTPMFTWFLISNFFSIHNVSKKFMMTLMGKWMTPFILLSLAGMPPTTGFFLKWMSMYIMWANPMYMTLLILGSLMSLYFYLNMLFSSIIIWSTKPILYKSSSTMLFWSYTWLICLFLLIPSMML